MKRSGRSGPAARRAACAVLVAAVLVVPALVAAAVPAPAPAATVTGVMKGGLGYKVLLVQANGKARKAAIAGEAGRFSIAGARLGNATLQLVKPDGSYWWAHRPQGHRDQGLRVHQGHCRPGPAHDLPEERLRESEQHARPAGTRRSRRTPRRSSTAARPGLGSSAASAPSSRWACGAPAQTSTSTA